MMNGMNGFPSKPYIMLSVDWLGGRALHVSMLTQEVSVTSQTMPKYSNRQVKMMSTCTIN